MNPILELVLSILLALYYILEALVLALIPSEWKKKKDVSQDIALITGGGSGIGRLMALKLAEEGTKIVLWDINKRGNEETAKLIEEIGGEAYTYVVDITQRSEVHQASLRVKDDVGVVTILVNNAGIVSGSNLLDTSDNKILKTFDVNVLAHFWTLKEFLPGMIRMKRGHVVTISSLAGLVGVNQLSDYCASKFSCLGLHESINLEMEKEKHEGLDFTIVCPFFINTGMFEGVASPFLPIMEPDYVADEILKGIQYRKDIIILPKICSALITLKAILPRKAILALVSALHLTDTMTKFVGRGKTN